MALPDISTLIPDTAVTWKASGGTAVITLTSLSNSAGREGDKVSIVSVDEGTPQGIIRPEVILVRFDWQPASAVTNGNQVELYFAESTSGTAGSENPGGLTGADASVTSPDEKKLQCNLVGGLNLSNALGTAVQSQYFWYYPTSSILIPFVVNKSGQSGGSTAGNFAIVATPYYRKIVE